MDTKSKETDWTNYYQKNRSFFSVFTQRYTLDKILQALTTYTSGQKLRILELGGANSCFAEAICLNSDIECYDVVDNNELGVNMFNKKNLNTASHEGILGNLTKEVEWVKQYDFVYSIGLIEHFNKADRDKVIESHFRFCKENGIVMISFPTPTLKYRFVRKCMEMIGAWQFWDEQPLVLNDVKNCLEKDGIIEQVELNKELPLSQMIAVIRKSVSTEKLNIPFG